MNRIFIIVSPDTIDLLGYYYIFIQEGYSVNEPLLGHEQCIHIHIAHVATHWCFVTHDSGTFVI